jgi:hypothetical protein
MSNSRRTFVKAGLMTALFAAVPLRSAFGKGFKNLAGVIPLFDEDDPLANYTKSTFVSYLNSVFQIQTGSGNVAVTLTSVDDRPAPTGGECFSLLFVGGSTPRNQNTYVVSHPALGTFNLFLVPAGADENGAQKSVATINRLPPA